MKTHLEPQQVLCWSLFGMKPMHRALLRRSVERAASPLAETATKRFELTWNVFESQDPLNESFSDGLNRPGVLIMDSGVLVKQIENQKDCDLNVDLPYQRSNAQIRLLWNWCRRGKEDLMWCTELSFDGVICDLASMNQWVRICLKQGKTSQGQFNTLLRDLQLPKIVHTPAPSYSQSDLQCGPS